MICYKTFPFRRKTYIVLHTNDPHLKRIQLNIFSVKLKAPRKICIVEYEPSCDPAACACRYLNIFGKPLCVRKSAYIKYLLYSLFIYERIMSA